MTHEKVGANDVSAVEEVMIMNGKALVRYVGAFPALNAIIYHTTHRRHWA